MTDNENELPDHPLQALHDQLEERFGSQASVGENELPDQWLDRMQVSNMLMCYDDAAARDLPTVRSLKAAEERGLVTFNLDSLPVLNEDDTLADEPDPAAEIRALPVHERFRGKGGYLEIRKSLMEGTER